MKKLSVDSENNWLLINLYFYYTVTFVKVIKNMVKKLSFLYVKRYPGKFFEDQDMSNKNLLFNIGKFKLNNILPRYYSVGENTNLDLLLKCCKSDNIENTIFPVLFLSIVI